MVKIKITSARGWEGSNPARVASEVGREVGGGSAEFFLRRGLFLTKFTTWSNFFRNFTIFLCDGGSGGPNKPENF